MNALIEQFNGYFHALRRLGGSEFYGWAFVIEVESNVRESLLNHLSDCDLEQEVLEEKVIDYAGVQVLLDEYIFSKLQITDEDTLGLLKWDIVEYYGLASLELDIDADFNPLVRKGAIQFTMCPSSHESHVYYVIPISNYAIVTGLAICA
ncbi:TPA: hypothetical protein GRR81_25475 [Vibrio parahaemolyticus]|nr:hypothetical protein [Vibrio parahaemolyticus]HAS6444399.1 hypothetical protein [Vibrio parahaemolyticus]